MQSCNFVNKDKQSQMFSKDLCKIDVFDLNMPMILPYNQYQTELRLTWLLFVLTPPSDRLIADRMETIFHGKIHL